MTHNMAKLPNEICILPFKQDIMVVSLNDGSATTRLELLGFDKADLTPPQAVELAAALIRSARKLNPPDAPPLRIVIH